MGILQLKPKGLETRRSQVTEGEKALGMLVATQLWATAGLCPQKMAKETVQLPQAGCFQWLWKGSSHGAGLQGKLTWGAADGGLFLTSKQDDFILGKVRREGWPEALF